MFSRARLKLTIWYVLITMVVSICFSLAMYEASTTEFDRVERAQRLRQERTVRPRPINELRIDPDVLEESKTRLRLILILIDLTILAGSSIAGFFLAGRTLKPIREMVEEQNRFIADASHELRTPITSLKTEIEVDLRDKKLKKETKQILESNLEEVNKLKDLSDELLLLASYEIPNGINLKKNSILKIINKTVGNVSTLAKHKNIKILNNAEDSQVLVDPDSIYRLLVIVLENAIKYSTSKTKIEIKTYKEKDYVVIGVKDQGLGIAKKDLPHIFERFYRADESRTKNNLGGYGLGLSIAKRIVGRHGGQIRVKSELGKGSEFLIYLPKSF